MCVYVCVCMCAYACVSVRACVCVCVRVRMRVFVRLWVRKLNERNIIQSKYMPDKVLKSKGDKNG
jgi:hypothetical protein